MPASDCTISFRLRPARRTSDTNHERSNTARPFCARPEDQMKLIALLCVAFAYAAKPVLPPI